MIGRERALDALKGMAAEISTLRSGRSVRGMWWNFAPYTFLLDLFPVAGPGDIFVILMRNITRFRAMEDESRREETLVLLAKVASEILHEMKGPLTGVKGAAQLLKEGFDPELVRILETETRRLEAMVLEMVELSKPTSFEFRETNIHEMLDDALGLFRGMMKEKGIDVERRFDPSLPPIPVDAEKLKRAVSNLVKNAIEAMRERGKITLSTRLSMDSVYTPGRNMVSILIQDTGPGLPDGFENWLFAPYRSSKDKGLGLGLAISYRIIKEHRGLLHYPERGMFEILLPLRRA